MIFDLDGTLLDTLEDLATAANATLEQYGFSTHPVDSYRYFVGDGLKNLIQRILPEEAVSEEQLSQCIETFNNIYGKTWKVRTAPYEGIVEMLDSLAAAGLQLAILSNKPHEFTKICVKEFFSDCPFVCVYGQREGVPKKPDPAGALEIAGEMGLDVSEILYVGDTATDMKTGNSAGMKSIGVEWGFRDRAELQNHNAWKVVSTPAEVVSHAL